MTYINDDFVNRVQRLSEKKSGLSNGFGMTVNGYGEMALCKRKSREFNPKRGLAIVLLAFFGLKGVFYNQLGPMTYEGRIGSLEQGMMIERFGARLMRADPVTLWIAGQIDKISGPTDIKLSVKDQQTIWSKLFSQNNLTPSAGALKSTFSK